MSDKLATAEQAQATTLMSTYQRFPITIVKGKGCSVWDDQGMEYLDFASGIGTCNLGHVPEAVEKQVANQLSQLWHCSNLYHHPAQQELADLLTTNSFGDEVFLCNSGAEANEAAIKLARRYAQKVKGTNAYEVVTFTQSFHGRTLGTLSATGQAKIQDGFAPLLPGFRCLPYNDSAALEELVTPETCAVLLELVQGEGGVHPAEKEWIEQLAAICQENDLLLMVDEVQTGIGRTGKLFAYEHYGIEPDVMSLAKGLGSGFPLGAVVAKKHVAKAFVPGTHGTTLGGNPLASTAGLATMTHLLGENIVQQAETQGSYLAGKLQQMKQKYQCIQAIRGLGLMQGIVLDGTVQAKEIITKGLEQGVLLLPAGPDVVRLLPPLIITTEEIDQAVAVLENIFGEIESGESE